MIMAKLTEAFHVLKQTDDEVFKILDSLAQMGMEKNSPRMIFKLLFNKLLRSSKNKSLSLNDHKIYR